ncbi:MAG TPA: hypothetical protein GXX57_04105 [Firmicutes bacterium]|nr:hypothetical protein [Bacillota bacterium]
MLLTAKGQGQPERKLAGDFNCDRPGRKLGLYGLILSGCGRAGSGCSLLFRWCTGGKGLLRFLLESIIRRSVGRECILVFLIVEPMGSCEHGTLDARSG